MTEAMTGGAATPVKFGIFIAPCHDPAGNPTLQMQRDLELVELADRLGFDEAWVGEHLSNGFETIASPEVFLAAAAGRTQRIRLGTGVNSLPYHHPFTLANRIVLLDHLSRGRAMLGMGPGQSVNDAAMMGIDHRKTRDMMVEAAEAIVPLLRGEAVTRQTSWYTLDNARLQLSPCNPAGIEAAVASVFSPAGSTLAGRLGLGLLSLAASDLVGFEGLDTSWANLQKHAADSGRRVDRSQWRVLGAMHLAETAEQARREVLTSIVPSMVTLPSLVSLGMGSGGEDTRWMTDADAALEKWTTEGIGPFGGVATIGTPDEGVAAVRRLLDKSGGFGTYLLLIHNAAPWAATKRSLEMFAEYVIPEIQQLNSLRHASMDWLRSRSGQLRGEMRAAIDEAKQKYGSGAESTTPEIEAIKP